MRDGKLNEALFERGMKQLALCRPQQERNLSAADVALRAEAYYEAIGHELSDEEWVFAVREANRGQTFFPSPSELIEYGKLYRPQRAALPAPRPTEADLEEQRRVTRRGLEQVRAAVAAAGKPGLLEQPAVKNGRFVTPGAVLGEVLQELGAEQRAEINELATTVVGATSNEP